MNKESPLIQAQQAFIDKIPFRAMATESVTLENAIHRVLAVNITAPIDSPPYPRSIVEGFLVATSSTRNASETNPVSFTITGKVEPGDPTCPAPKGDEAIEVVTGSIVPAGAYSVVRMFEATRTGSGAFTINRPFPPGFFIEAQGCDVKKGQALLNAGSVISPRDIGTLASLGLKSVRVCRKPKVTIFASGNEVLPHDQPLKPGYILDCNTPMLAAAVHEWGSVPVKGGIQKDDFDAFAGMVKKALGNSDMIVISGGTAVGGRDFISDLVRSAGELIVDGVPMRSGRPLIMGVAQGKPIVCVAGHPPEALRGFQLFGVAALNRLLGRNVGLPADPAPPMPPKK